MVLAIESCHRHGFIHRDIKPDVSLLDLSCSWPSRWRGKLLTLPRRIFCSTLRDISNLVTLDLRKLHWMDGHHLQVFTLYSFCLALTSTGLMTHPVRSVALVLQVGLTTLMKLHRLRATEAATD